MTPSLTRRDWFRPALGIAILIAIGLTLVLTLRVDASEAERDYIDVVAQAALDAVGIDDETGQPADIDEFFVQVEELAATVADPATSPACRDYADMSMLVLLLFELNQHYPDSSAIPQTVQGGINLLPGLRERCFQAQ